MSKTIRTLFVIVLLSLLLTVPVLTAGAAGGGCPPGYMLHMAHDHDGHHAGHLHVGTDADQNGDGYICVKEVTPGSRVHVHIDNAVK